MAKATDAPGVDNVQITLDGKIIELVPSAGAIFALESLPGGIFSDGNGDDSVYRRVHKCDTKTMCAVIRAGVGAGAGADKELPTKVFEAGLFTLRPQLELYLFRLGNGGRAPVVDEEPAKEDDAGNV